jgi:hypothetical protein
MIKDKNLGIIPPMRDNKSVYRRKYPQEYNKNSKKKNSTLADVGVSERILNVFQLLGSLYRVI